MLLISCDFLPDESFLVAGHINVLSLTTGGLRQQWKPR